MLNMKKTQLPSRIDAVSSSSSSISVPRVHRYHEKSKRTSFLGKTDSIYSRSPKGQKDLPAHTKNCTCIGIVIKYSFTIHRTGFMYPEINSITPRLPDFREEDNL